MKNKLFFVLIILFFSLNLKSQEIKFLKNEFSTTISKSNLRRLFDENLDTTSPIQQTYDTIFHLNSIAFKYERFITKRLAFGLEINLENGYGIHDYIITPCIYNTISLSAFYTFIKSKKINTDFGIGLFKTDAVVPRYFYGIDVFFPGLYQLGFLSNLRVTYNISDYVFVGFLVDYEYMIKDLYHLENLKYGINIGCRF